MVYVPDKATRMKNYQNSTGAVPAKYGAGIARTTDWKEKALNGQGLYEEQMRKSDVLARRNAGLEKVSNEQWKQKAQTLGVQRIASGMMEGAQRQADNYEPVAQALRALSLPERTSDAMANIDNRVKPVVQAAKSAVGK
jgi:hypothetical protein